MFQILLPLLTFLTVTSFAGAILAARAVRRQPVQDRLRELSGEVNESAVLTDEPRFFRFLGRVGKAASAGRTSPGLKADLAKAGYHGSAAAPIYLGAKILLLPVGLLGMTLAMLPFQSLPLPARLMGILWGGAILFFVPNIVVRTRRKHRRDEVRTYLSDALDLLEICVSSGMGLDIAWNSVADEIREVSRTLADEMALANLEIHLGAPRAVAMRHMAERTGAEEISSLVAVLVQSDRFGTSVADALRTFATTMREVRSQRAEEAAEKMAVKLLFPMILLIFPAVLAVICGPAGLQWAQMLSS